MDVVALSIIPTLPSLPPSLPPSLLAYLRREQEVQSPIVAQKLSGQKAVDWKEGGREGWCVSERLDEKQMTHRY